MKFVVDALEAASPLSGVQVAYGHEWLNKPMKLPNIVVVPQGLTVGAADRGRGYALARQVRLHVTAVDWEGAEVVALAALAALMPELNLTGTRMRHGTITWSSGVAREIEVDLNYAARLSLADATRAAIDEVVERCHIVSGDAEWQQIVTESEQRALEENP